MADQPIRVIRRKPPQILDHFMEIIPQAITPTTFPDAFSQDDINNGITQKGLVYIFDPEDQDNAKVYLMSSQDFIDWLNSFTVDYLTLHDFAKTHTNKQKK